MSRPSFQFYTKDWRANSKLRRCSPASRGVWVDILCALHDSDEYGIARYPLKELASEVGASLAHVRELVEKGVLKGSDSAYNEPLIYRPKSGRKEGPPVTLLDRQAGPIWFSSRMVKDEYVRNNRGESSRYGDDEGEAPKPPKKPAPKPPFGDGSSSASAFASANPPPGGPRTGDVGSNHDPKRYAAMATRLEAAGIRGASPGNLQLQALVDAGVGFEEFEAYIPLALKAGDPFPYLLRTVLNERDRLAARGAVPAVPDKPWDSTWQTISAKGVELGIGPWTEDLWAAAKVPDIRQYTAKVRAALERRETAQQAAA